MLTSIPAAEYHASDGISKHGLDDIAQSPAHYRYRKDNPTPQTPAMAFGEALHCAVLEPHEFTSRYVEAIKCDRRTKVGKAQWQEFQDSLPDGAIVLQQDDWQRIHAMQESICQHPIAGTLLSSGKAEQSGWWTDPATGVMCRLRADFLSDTHLVGIDLKTAASASRGAFARACAQFRYHVQASWYSWGLEQLGHPVEAFIFIVVEKDPPHAVAEYVLDDDAVDLGEKLMSRNLQTYAECLAADKWPSYPTEVQTLTLPKYAFYED